MSSSSCGDSGRTSKSFKVSLKKAGVRITEKISTGTWNPEDFLVPDESKKPPQVTWDAMPELHKEKELAVVQLLV